MSLTDELPSPEALAREVDRLLSVRDDPAASDGDRLTAIEHLGEWYRRLNDVVETAPLRRET